MLQLQVVHSSFLKGCVDENPKAVEEISRVMTDYQHLPWVQKGEGLCVFASPILRAVDHSSESFYCSEIVQGSTSISFLGHHNSNTPDVKKDFSLVAGYNSFKTKLWKVVFLCCNFVQGFIASFWANYLASRHHNLSNMVVFPSPAGMKMAYIFRTLNL